MHTPTDKTAISDAKESIGAYSKLVSLLREYIDIDKQLEQLSNLPEAMKTHLDEVANEENAAYQSLLKRPREAEDELEFVEQCNELSQCLPAPHEDCILRVAPSACETSGIYNRDNKE